MARGLHVGGPLRGRSPQERIDLENEIAEEIAFHLEMRAEENRACGMPDVEARAAARTQFGDVDRITVACIDAGDGHPLRMAGRRLRATMTIGVGLGIAASILLVSYAVLVRPPATYQDSDSWVGIWWQSDGQDAAPESSMNEFESWMEHNTVFEKMALAAYRMSVFDDGATADPTMAKFVSPGYLDLHGAEPYLGRNFIDNRPEIDGLPGVVIAYDFWKSRFSSDTGIVGRHVLVDGREYAITGVAPPNFRMYNPTAFWIPYDLEKDRWRDVPLHLASGKMKAGVNLSDVRADLARITPAVSPRRGDPNTWTVWPRNAQEIYGSGVSETAWLFAAIAMLAVVALLLRSGGEVAALSDLIPAGLVAAVVSALSLGILAQATLGSTGHRFNLDFNPVLYLLVFVSVVTGAWIFSAFRRLLANPITGAFQIAAAFAAIVAALMATRVATLDSRNSDMLDPDERVVVVHDLPAVDIFLPRATFENRELQVDFYDRTVRALRKNPELRRASLVRRMTEGPLSVKLPVRAARIDKSDTITMAAHAFVVDSTYFAQTGLRLVDGRFFSAGDGLGAPRVGVVTSSLAAMLWPEANAIGEVCSIGAHRVQFQVIGIVEDAQPAVYASVWQLPGHSSIVTADFGIDGDKTALAAMMAAAVRGVDNRVAVVPSRSGSDRSSTVTPAWRLALALWLMALTMIVVVWRTVAEAVRKFVLHRARDIGTRRLLGASTPSVMQFSSKPAAKPSLLGLAMGFPLAFAMNELTVQAFETPRYVSPWLYLAAVVVIIVVIALASLPSLIGAAKIQPIATRQRSSVIQTQVR